MLQIQQTNSEMIVSSMETANDYYRTWCCKPHLVVENCDDSSRQENDGPGMTKKMWGFAAPRHPGGFIGEDHTSQVVVTSDDISSTSDLFERVRQSIVLRRRLC
ncbi:hypothetical protein TNCV_4989561 [Trichonephila clavipes]|uniref:Uncharacterized protein n=1 Tax=Trichonephila clavipes TaxID=2585209 RepID=A0A8X7BIA6_TRICX|nr:hypothetical protein TNCV_4989561 [Trichonephila clavipes]